LARTTRSDFDILCSSVCAVAYLPTFNCFSASLNIWRAMKTEGASLLIAAKLVITSAMLKFILSCGLR